MRQYYDFYDVDTDRYSVDGDLRQVMLSGRELAIERNTDADSWVNQRIIYTHGIGLAMVPVNEVTPEGQPRLWVRDLPPISNSGAPEITQPRIYFGERDNHYVIVRARQAEFDYPEQHRHGRGPDDVVDRPDRRPARLHPHPAPVRAPLPRPRPPDHRPDPRPTASCCSIGRSASGWG